jgi:uncharacterized protein YukE
MAGTRQLLLQQAAEKEALAAVFDAQVKRLEAVFHGIPTAPGASNGYWTGPAADRYTTQARQMQHGVEELTASCIATARNLRQRAIQLRQYAAHASDI